jgi:hypothetical protein
MLLELSGDFLETAGLLGDSRGAWRRHCGWGGGRSWGWRGGWRLQVFYFGGGYLHGSEAVAREVVDHDAEEVLAFGGSADLLTVLNAIGDVFLNLVERGGYVETGADPVDEKACGLKTKMTSSKSAWILPSGRRRNVMWEGSMA